MFGFYYPDADAVLADPDGRVIVTDGRNHLELTTERFDIIVTDPPPPIESSGASVISSLEYYQAGRDHLTPGGVMMQWVPFGAPEAEFKEHIRTFASVFPNVDGHPRAPAGTARTCWARTSRSTFDPTRSAAVLARPGRPRGHLVGLRLAGHHGRRLDRRSSTRQHWLDGRRRSRAYVGDGPLITDDRPRPEYFLLRRSLGLQ